MADIDSTAHEQAPLGTGPAPIKQPIEAAPQHSSTAAVPDSATTTVQTEDQQRPKGFVPRKLLLILHGKRIDDDQIRDAIQQLKHEGHEVREVGRRDAHIPTF